MNKKKLKQNEGSIFSLTPKPIGFTNPEAGWVLLCTHGSSYRFLNIETGHSFPMTADFVHSHAGPGPNAQTEILKMRKQLHVDGPNLYLADTIQ